MGTISIFDKGEFLMVNALTHPRVGTKDAWPSPGIRILSFHAAFGKKYAKVAPTWKLAPPTRENAGFATEVRYLSSLFWD